MVSGALLFAAATAGLLTATETVKPEWRDPEYAHRLHQIRRWQRERPERPLVLAVGSSRVQQGFSPAAMAFPDEAGAPLPYNLGVRGATPVLIWLQLARALDDGVRPRAVVVMISGFEFRLDRRGHPFRGWGPRVSEADIRRLAAFDESPRALSRERAEVRRRPWKTYAPLLIDDLCPLWELPENTFRHTAWSRADQYGFCPRPKGFANPNTRARDWTGDRLAEPSVVNTTPVSDVSVQAVHAVITRCQTEGIPVALVWAPESPAYRERYTPQGRANNAALAESLSARFGVSVFPTPDDLLEEDFADSVHLLPAGAEKYSRWLAENHLKPWLARVLK